MSTQQLIGSYLASRGVPELVALITQPAPTDANADLARLAQEDEARAWSAVLLLKQREEVQKAAAAVETLLAQLAESTRKIEGDPRLSATGKATDLGALATERVRGLGAIAVTMDANLRALRNNFAGGDPVPMTSERVVLLTGTKAVAETAPAPQVVETLRALTARERFVLGAVAPVAAARAKAEGWAPEHADAVSRLTALGTSDRSRAHALAGQVADVMAEDARHLLGLIGDGKATELEWRRATAPSLYAHPDNLRALLADRLAEVGADA
jgi:hypothetical protein